MPRGDGTGPTGQGPRTGRGGQGGGGQGGGGRGRMGGFAAGLGGNCICSQCGKVLPHQRATPCSQIKCPNCGVLMTRQR